MTGRTAALLLAAFVMPAETAAVHGQARADAVITLDEVLALAASANPRVQAAHALAEARLAAEPAGSVPPDPQLQLGVMNVSLPRLGADMPTSMVPAVQLMQMVPTAGKLSLSKQVARQSTSIARHEAEEVWWSVRLEVAREFYSLYVSDGQLAVMRETLRLLEQAREIARSMYAAGEGRQTDVLRAGVEIARMSGEIRRMAAMRQGSAARLNALLNRPADTPVPTPSVRDATPALASPDTLRAWAAVTRPMLQAGRVALEQARTRRALMQREIWPDVTLGVQYGQRPGSGMEPTERMGSVMLGFTIPVFARQRQLRARDEASAMQRMADADLSAMRAGVDAAIAQTLAELEQTRALLVLYGEEVLPQARANAASALTAYRADRVDFMTLLDARMTLNQFEQELYALTGAAGTLRAELEMIVGRELRDTTPAVTETS